VTRVVYRNVPQHQPAVISITKNVIPEEESSIIGVSMKEKEELDNFLVSGSE
jgi:hypothetical protein